MSKFFSRKIIALLTAIVAVIAIYGYTEFSIASQIKPTVVVMAKQDIPPNTKITKDMVHYVKIPGDAVPKQVKVIQNSKDILNHYTVPGYGISKSSLIFKNKVVKESERPDEGILGLKPYENTFSFQADVPITHGNALLPGQTIDLYAAILYDDTSGKKKPFVGRISRQVRILSVRDNTGEDVYSEKNFTKVTNKDGEEESQVDKKLRPAVLTVAVDTDSIPFLTKTRMVGTLIPVATGLSHPDEKVKEAIESGKVDIDEITTGANLPDVNVTRGFIEGISLDPSAFIKDVKLDDNVFKNDLDSIKEEYEEHLGKNDKENK